MSIHLNYILYNTKNNGMLIHIIETKFVNYATFKSEEVNA